MSRPILLAAMALVSACTLSREYAPHSRPIEVGGSVESIVATDCGLDSAVFDIDGSLWIPTLYSDGDREGVPDGFNADNDPGTLTLVSEAEAEYRSSEGRVIPLTRVPGNLVVHDC